MTKTATHRLIDIEFGSDLEEHVSAARASGESWNSIARTIYDRTRIAVTPETLRTWFSSLPSGSEAKSA